MSAWTHVLCGACYAKHEPGRTPHLVRGQDAAPCCDCGELADPPINYRADPQRFGCHGTHDDDAD